MEKVEKKLEEVEQEHKDDSEANYTKMVHRWNKKAEKQFDSTIRLFSGALIIVLLAALLSQVVAQYSGILFAVLVFGYIVVLITADRQTWHNLSETLIRLADSLLLTLLCLVVIAWLGLLRLLEKAGLLSRRSSKRGSVSRAQE